MRRGLVTTVAFVVLASTSKGSDAPDERFLTLADGAYAIVAGPGVRIVGKPITVQAWFRTTAKRGHVYSCGFENGPPHVKQSGYALYFEYPGKVRFGANHSEEGFTYDRWDNALPYDRWGTQWQRCAASAGSRYRCQSAAARPRRSPRRFSSGLRGSSRATARRMCSARPAPAWRAPSPWRAAACETVAMS